MLTSIRMIAAARRKLASRCNVVVTESQTSAAKAAVLIGGERQQ